jgi:serralysin
MAFRSASNLRDPFGGAFNSAWNDPALVNFQTSAAVPGGNSPPPPTPALSGEAIQAEAAFTGAATTVVVTSGGITFDLIFDAAASAAPASFRAGIEQAATILAATITNKITVNLEIDYSGTGGGASAGPDNGQFVNYSTVRTDLLANATPGDTIFNALPTGSTIQGQSSVAVWNAQLKLFGLLPANSTTTDDGSATFATDINPNLLVGVALHELTHAMGRVPYGPQPDIFDFYRYTSPGTLLFSNSIPATAAYFSVDGGNTKIADYGQTSDPSDFLNPPGSNLTPNDAFNEFYNNSTNQTLTAIDKEQLDALGFNLALPQGTVIESYGSTSLVQVGNNYYLDSNATGTGPELKFNGAAFAVGQAGTWTPIATEQTATGYEVAFQNTANPNQFSIWLTDSNGNETSSDGVVLGTSAALESAETSFQQDLNGDGVIGIANIVIESYGSTSLVQVGNNYYLYSNATNTGPELQFNGAPFVVGQAGTWTPIGAEQTATGYEVAFHNTASPNQFSIWLTNSNGMETSNDGVVLGNSVALESAETSFQQDLNGDGVIGITNNIVIESYGSTNLVQAGNDYYLYSNTTGTGPELQFNGAPFVVGQAGSWTPIGAEQTATGYEVAFQNTANPNQFSIWLTNSNGMETSNDGVVLGTSMALESAETSFHQDLNGDGVIGIPPAPTTPAATTPAFVAANPGSIEADGSSGAPPQNGGQTSILGIWSATSERSSNGWQFDFAAHSGSASTVEPGLLAPWHDAQAGQQPPTFTPANNDHETVLHQDGTTAATGFFADLHAGHFFFH